jgi:hypothetical protein
VINQTPAVSPWALDKQAAEPSASPNGGPRHAASKSGSHRGAAVGELKRMAL